MVKIPLRHSSWAPGVYLVVVIALAIWLRWLYIVNVGLHVDEFSTLWGSRQVMNSGLPLMPSGVLYTRGLFSTYVIAAVGKVFGLTFTAGRMPSLVFGVLAVVAAFFLAGAVGMSASAGWRPSCWRFCLRRSRRPVVPDSMPRCRSGLCLPSASFF